MPTSKHEYAFPIKVTKRAQHFDIKFLTIPKLTASGEIYAEAEYYAYRVLADHLLPLKAHPEKIQALTNQTMTDKATDDHSFLCLIFVPANLDPHKMQAQFIIPRDSAAHAHAALNKITHLIDEKTPF